ncbi:unnamed protein product [Ostreobium quekettii]|uniref:FAS1 domain-containing protein n=1 Tax=Ostreobium quekettii TaxID=121088 RepID=A0A8S1JB25_9CHLO|nr:unnamed protein product [Ostreobium quekettii]|eukprot:evm.model.scf_529.4 EVM.evm.TU.scf_529.4   scf_529:28251-33898(+)
MEAQRRCRSWIVRAVVLAALAATARSQSVALENAGCDCSDIDPRVAHDGPPIEGNCILQREWGQCAEPFLLDTIEEIPEGYCQITCGRCDCCKTYRELALEEGFLEFVSAMDAAELGDVLDNPGFMASLLVPPEGSIAEWLKLPSTGQISAVTISAADKANLQGMLKIHVVMPEVRANAPWTTPFFLDGVHMMTMEGRALAVRDKGGQVVIHNGKSSKVHLLGGDKEACKGFIHFVDGVLTPDAKGIPGSKVPAIDDIPEHIANPPKSDVHGLPSLPAWPARLGPFGFWDTVNPVAQPQAPLRSPTPPSPEVSLGVPSDVPSNDAPSDALFVVAADEPPSDASLFGPPTPSDASVFGDGVIG